MEDQVELILELINEVLKEPKKVYNSKLQYGYDCPNCVDIKGLDHGDNKGNLEVNLNKFVYHCWSCGISGPLGKLFDLYGTKKQKKVYDLIKPEELKVEEIRRPKVRLPEGYLKFEESSPRFIPHIEAYKYLQSRGITDDIIKKYNIGYTVKGDFAYRIIVPSYNSEGVLNYFIARAWTKSKLKYKNPSIEKDKIIFNENIINWEEDIHICEGVFDSFFLKNCVILLGKKMSDLIFSSLYEKANGNITICLDEDAWEDALKLYHTLNGGRLYNKIKIIKPPKGLDVADLRGNIDDYFIEIK
jgi:DNA primase